MAPIPASAAQAIAIDPQAPDLVHVGFFASSVNSIFFDDPFELTGGGGDDGGATPFSSRIEYMAPSVLPLDVVVEQAGGSYEVGDSYQVRLLDVTDWRLFDDGFESGDTTAWNSSLP